MTITPKQAYVVLGVNAVVTLGVYTTGVYLESPLLGLFAFLCVLAASVFVNLVVRK